MNCRTLDIGDMYSACAAMRSLHKAQKASGYVDLSPGCCAKQSVIEASICARWASQTGATDTGLQCIKVLTACKLAVAMEPTIWWEVSST